MVFAVGVLLAALLNVAPSAAQTPTSTATTTETTTSVSTTTLPATTVSTTTTIERTTTRLVPLGTSTTTSSSETTGTPAWIWALVAILAVGLVVVIVLLARRGDRGLSVEEQRQKLDAAVGSWVAQGWAIESETTDSTVLRRGNETMLVSVDQAGHVSTRPLPGT